MHPNLVIQDGKEMKKRERHDAQRHDIRKGDRSVRLRQDETP